MSEPVETALLVTVPAADPVVGRHRSRLDRAARVGVPAHVTVVYPFVPFAALRQEDLATVGALVAQVPAFTLTFERIAWFGHDVVFLEPTPAQPVLDLISLLGEAFPQHLPYGGAYDEPVPHLTVGHDHPFEELQLAEVAVLAQLPLAQRVEAISLWAGPPLLTERPGWRQVGSFPLALASR